MKMLMVCLGNICRSPLAQGILEKKIKEHQLDWYVDSAGTNGKYNENKPPYHLSIQVAQAHNIHIHTQKARQLVPEDIYLFDKIWVMDTNNLQDAKTIFNAPAQEQKLSLILDILPHQQGQCVPDPFGYGIEAFENVYQLLEEACEAIIQTYKQ